MVDAMKSFPTLIVLLLIVLIPEWVVAVSTSHTATVQEVQEVTITTFTKITIMTFTIVTISRLLMIRLLMILMIHFQLFFRVSITNTKEFIVCK